MATEIELKAWVDDPAALRDRISSLAEYGTSFEKEDTYWFPETGGGKNLSPSGIRVRKEWDVPAPGDRGSRIILVTYKTKEIREGIEVNEEREFEVSDGEAFEELLTRLGFRGDISKKKRGWAWNYGDIRIELSQVAGLGWFTELEILAGNAEPETVRTARKGLLSLLGKLGIGEDKIESRYYTELLRTRGGPRARGSRQP
ncbi:MAG: class IV adenylate cyclase [Treponema sp.]|jgi:adenylate cyclase class 2|nr:class IV adenylate cyclase [Treponema sp.]